VYFTDGTKEGVLKIDKYKGATSIQMLYRNRTVAREPRAIKAYASIVQVQVDTNPCGNDNGGCDHLCVVGNVVDDNGKGATNATIGTLGFECACRIGYQLDEKLKGCNRESCYSNDNLF
jgi:low density lipoprotein-related protein 2